MMKTMWTHLNANKRQALFSSVRIVLQYNERHHKELRLVRFPCGVFSISSCPFRVLNPFCIAGETIP